MKRGVPQEGKPTTPWSPTSPCCQPSHMTRHDRTASSDELTGPIVDTDMADLRSATGINNTTTCRPESAVGTNLVSSAGGSPGRLELVRRRVDPLRPRTICSRRASRAIRGLRRQSCPRSRRAQPQRRRRATCATIIDAAARPQDAFAILCVHK
jgi:hypothetical protein